MHIRDSARGYWLAVLVSSLFLLAGGCGQEEGGIRSIGGGGIDSSLPPEVRDAITAGLDEVEVPETGTSGGVAKPTGFSTIFHIDYASPVHTTPDRPTDTSCGDASKFKKLVYKWTAFPVPYSIDTRNLTAGTNPEAAKAAVVGAFATWDAEEHPAGNFFVENPANAKVTVSWAPIDGAGGTLAFASTRYFVATKAAVRSLVQYDSDDTWRVFGATSCTGDSTQGFAFDIEDVGAHEIGHVIGLGHTPQDLANNPLTMYPFILHVGETLKRTLGTGDRKGIADIYR